LVLEARISSNYEKRQAGDAETVAWAEVAAEALVGDAVAVVSATLPPVAMIIVPVLGSMLLPGAAPDTLLPTALWWTVARLPGLLVGAC
jgi:hypothetical protein